MRDDRKKPVHRVVDIVVIALFIPVILVHDLFEFPKRTINGMMYPVVMCGVPSFVGDIFIYISANTSWYYEFIFSGFDYIYANIRAPNTPTGLEDLPNYLMFLGFVFYLLARFRFRFPAPDVYGWINQR